jgi:hypothetical protein
MLGDINSSNRGAENFSLAPKYLAKIAAEDLLLYFKYKRIGKKTPFRIENESLVKVDSEIQRGLIPETGNLRQEEKKIDEIRDSLLGISKENPKVFLGTLVWNVRPPSKLSQVVIDRRNGEPLEYELEIDTEAIWLTDSAHRHIGICEAVKAKKAKPNEYPRFKLNFEFPLEIYNLDSIGEKMLFKELNSKQKKITAAKAQQVDATSKVGLLKSRIIEIDQSGSGQRLLYQNIEVNSNVNDRHTLMTMSLFSASIKEMFGTKLINESSEDDDLRELLADYYLKFIYKLNEVIVVKCELRGKVEDVRPFCNLYTAIIQPEEDLTADMDDDAIVEKRLNTARAGANLLNKTIRDQEKIHSNPVIKALASIGGYVRYMGNWDKVIQVLQSKLILQNNGRYFQVSNEKLQVPRSSGVTIATKNEDGKSLNIQVVSQVVQEIELLLKEELDLIFTPKLELIKNDISHNLSSLGGYTIFVKRSSHTYIDLRFEFDVGSTFIPEKSSIKLRIQAEFSQTGIAWKDAERKGVDRLIPKTLGELVGYEHPTYGAGVKRYFATFEIDFPEYVHESNLPFRMKLNVEFPSFDATMVELPFILNTQIE